MAELPISVVVPHIASRDEFFQGYCLPSIWANEPTEVIILSGDEHVQWKRNEGAYRATSEFLFFCDDDVVLESNILSDLLAALGDRFDFAYCDYGAVNHPVNGVVGHTARPFNVATLRRANYISTMSLVRASMFPGFDESISRLQDWDLWLTMTERGSNGVYVPRVGFVAHWLDSGITNQSKAAWQEAENIVREKHGL